MKVAKDIKKALLAATVPAKATIRHMVNMDHTVDMDHMLDMLPWIKM